MKKESKNKREELKWRETERGKKRGNKLKRKR